MSGEVLHEYYLAAPLDTVKLRKAFIVQKETQRIDVANGALSDVFIKEVTPDSFVACVSRLPHDNTISTYDNYYHCDFLLRVNNSTQISRIRRVFYRCCEVEIDFYRRHVDTVTKFVYDSQTASFVLALAPFGLGGALLVTEVMSRTEFIIELDSSPLSSASAAFCGFFLEWHNCELNVGAFVKRFYGGESKEERGLSRRDLLVTDLETITLFGNGRAMIGKDGFKAEFRAEEAQRRGVALYNPFHRQRNTKEEISENLGCLVYAAEEKLESVCDRIPFSIPSPYNNIVLDSFPPCKMVIFPGERKEEVEAYLQQSKAFNYVFKPLWKEVQMDEEEVALANWKRLAKGEFEYACYLFLSGRAEEEDIVWKSTGTTEPPLPETFEGLYLGPFF